MTRRTPASWTTRPKSASTTLSRKKKATASKPSWHRGGTADIYSVTGLLVKKNATANDVKALKKGIYIVNGKKFIKK